LAKSPKKTLEISFAEREERADNTGAFDAGVGGHTGEAGQGGAAQKAEEDRLGLIVPVMGENNAPKVLLSNHLPEQGQSQGAVSGGGIGRKVGEGKFQVTSTRNRAGDAEPMGQVAHKFGVAVAVGTTGLVVEVDDMKPKARGLVQGNQQCGAVGAAGDADGVSAGGNGPASGRKWEIGLAEHLRDCHLSLVTCHLLFIPEDTPWPRGAGPIFA
jgi:hypothetical protein